MTVHHLEYAVKYGAILSGAAAILGGLWLWQSYGSAIWQAGMFSFCL
ncbi:hypothetical protein [Aureimonas fodinaquatilis]|nr:hypothetical protein [Aureimonas fodinaquatilis]